MKGKTAIAVVVLLLCAACTPRSAAEPAAQPTPSVVIKTTAQRLDATAVAALHASTSFDIPDGMYLVVWATESALICMTYCRCWIPEPVWGELTTDQQVQTMQGMMQKGARGFVYASTTLDYGPCACTVNEGWLEPIHRLPFTDRVSDATILRVDRDGVVTAQIGGIVYRLRPGDTWLSESQVDMTTTPADSEIDFEMCKSYTYSHRQWFRNGGLLDGDQVLSLSAPTPIPIPATPMSTAVTSTP